MKTRLSRLVGKLTLTLLAAVLATGIAVIPSEKVSATSTEGEIREDNPVDLDGSAYNEYWLKLVLTQDKSNIDIWSEGNDDYDVALYKEDKTTYTGYYDDDNGIDRNFFLSIENLPKGTYWLYVNEVGNITDHNDTTVYVKTFALEDIVYLTAEHFPDPIFLSLVVNDFELDGNSKLTPCELMRATHLECIDQDVKDFKGIELLKNLSSIYCENDDELVAFDAKNNKGLYSLSFSGCDKLSSIDVSGCSNLQSFGCDSNSKLKKITLGGNSNLKDFNCSGSSIQSLDLSSCKNSLIGLNCYDNKSLRSLDVSGFTRLVYLSCSNSKIKEIKASNCKKLESIDCEKNYTIQTLDLSGCTKLEYLYCSDNALESLDLSGCSKLTALYCNDNNLSSLNLSGCNVLTVLECSNNMDELTLDISDCTYLSTLYSDSTCCLVEEEYYQGTIGPHYCELSKDHGTKITKGATDVDVVELNSTNFPDPIFLAYVKIFDTDTNTKLSKIELSDVRSINVEAAGISSLKGIEYFTRLESLRCNDNNLKELDLSKNTKLQIIDCGNNDLTSLDLSNNTDLETLDCSGNTKLSGLNVSKCKNLETLGCPTCKLSTLDLSNNPDLRVLICSENSIKELDITDNDILLKVVKEGEYLEYTTGHRYYLYMNGIDCLLLYDKTTTIKTVKPTPTPTATPTAAPTATTAPTTAPAKPTTAPVITLTLDKTTVQIKCGGSSTLKATLSGSADKITWKSSDTKIATVDANGKVTTKQAGTVTITASAAGKSAACVVTILYKDVTSSKDFWFAPTNYLTAANVVKGYDKQTKFKPANDCTRAQMVTFLWRLAGEPAPKSTTTKFKDIKSKDYFYKPVLWAVEKGITTGVSKTKFNPQGVCTRAQTVTFLWRMANKPAPKTTKNKFKDVKSKDYFYKAVLWASEKKIVAGYSDGTFKPQGKCLRRQMVTFLYKYDKYVNGKG